MQGVKRTGLDQGLHRAFVQAAAVDPHAKVKQAGERAALFAGLDDGLDGLLACALDGAQTVANDFVRHRLKAMTAPVHVRRIKGQTEFQCVLVQHFELVGVVHFHRHVGAEKLGGVMHLEPAGVVRQQGVGGGVRLVEAVARELFHQVKHLVGFGFADVLLGRTGAENSAVLGHFFGLLFTHGTAQHVGAAQAVAAQNLRSLHHLLLVNHDAVGLRQHLGHQRVRVLNDFAPVFTRHKAGDQVHRAGTVQGVQRDQVFQAAGARIFQHALHARTFKLEHGFSFAVGKQLVGGHVVQRDVLERKVLLALVALDDELARDLQNRQRRQAQKVELDQANRFHVVFVVLAHCGGAARLLVQRAKIGQLARRDQHTAGVHAHVACHAFELLRQLQQRFNVVFFGQALRQHRFYLDGASDRDVLTRLIRDQLADAIAKGVAHVQHASHIANRCARGHGAESDNLRHRVAAVFVFDVFDHPVPVGLAKVNVKVGHGHPLGVQETLEQQVVLQRVQVGDLQRISHQGARTRAPARADRAAVALGPLNKVAHDQEVTRETHFQNGVQLKLQTLGIARALGVTPVLVGVQMPQSRFQAFVRDMAKIIFHRHHNAIDRRDRKVGQLRLAQHQSQVAALGNFQRVGQGTGHIGKQGTHLRAGFEILIAGEFAHPALVAQNFALRNTHPRFMRFIIVFEQKLHWVGGHHRQVQTRRQAHRARHLHSVFRPACALQLQVKTVRENRGQLQRHFGCARLIALHQSLTDGAGLRT